MVQRETDIDKKLNDMDSHNENEIEKYHLGGINLENPTNAHDFLIILTGKGKKVLELGCASGYITKILKERGCNVTGIELDPALAKKAEKFADKIIVGDLEQLNFDSLLNEKYDVILIGDILEHLKNPLQVLKKLRTVLNNDGFIVCSIPNIAHGSIRLQLLDGQFQYTETGLLDKTHLRFYTLNSILSMLNSAGFSITKLKRVKLDFFLGESMGIPHYFIPSELIKALKRDPESTTSQYVFKAVPSEEYDPNIKWTEQFSNRFVTTDLKNRIDDYKKPTTDLENLNKLLEESLASAQKTIVDYQQSFVSRMFRKYDNNIGKLIPLKPKKYLKTISQSPEEKKSVIETALTIPLEKKDIICFPILNWDYRYQRPQHILTHFAGQGHRIFYLTQNLKKCKTSYEIRLLKKNIFQIDLSVPKFFDIYKDELNPKLVQTLLNTIGKLQNELKIDAFCFVQFPTWCPLVLELKKLFGYKIIFDVLDDFTAFPNINKNKLLDEENLIKQSDLVISTSNLLFQKTKKFTNKTLLLPNAGEFEHFNQLGPTNFLNNYGKPIIGYFGSIAEWFDVKLVEYIAKERPHWTFIFIGHTYGSDIRNLEELSNVHFLGERPYWQLPKYLQSFDVCLIPFKITTLIKSTHPVKIYEYLSSGKPVVTTNLLELSSMSDLCYIANNKEDFLTKLDAAVVENDKKITKKRIKFASQNTWQNRFETLYIKLREIPSLHLKSHN